MVSFANFVTVAYNHFMLHSSETRQVQELLSDFFAMMLCKRTWHSFQLWHLYN